MAFKIKKNCYFRIKRNFFLFLCFSHGYSNNHDLIRKIKKSLLHFPKDGIQSVLFMKKKTQLFLTIKFFNDNEFHWKYSSEMVESLSDFIVIEKFDGQKHFWIMQIQAQD